MNSQIDKSESIPQLEQPAIEPVGYLRTVIDLLRQDEADYRGHRNDDQKAIAELASSEADEYFDKVLITVLDLNRIMDPTARIAIKPNDEVAEAQVVLGGIKDGVTLRDMRNSWRHLWVGINVLTNRLYRDSQNFKDAGLVELFEMDEKNKLKFMDTLFSNFQDLNALRFGAKGSGVKAHKIVYDLDGGEPQRIAFDRDKATSDKDIANNAARRKYNAFRTETSRPSTHPAGKLFPEEFIELRRQFPEVDMDKFARDVAYSKDVTKFYEDGE